MDEILKKQLLLQLESIPERLDGSATSTHIDNIQRILREYTEIDLSPSMYIGILLHDIIPKMLKPDTDTTGEYQKAFWGIYQQVQSLFPSDTTTGYDPEASGKNAITQDDFEEGIAFAIAGEEVENASESWRGAINTLINDPVELVKIKPLQEYVDTHTDVISRLHDAINGGQNGIDVSLKEFRAPMADVELMLDILTDWGIEPVLIKAAEVLDNLRRPNPKRPASAWRDAQELLSFYNPLLSIAGFDKLANECRSAALCYFHEGTEYLEEARKTHAIAEEYCKQNIGAIEEILHGVFDKQTSGSSEPLNPPSDITEYQGTNTMVSYTEYRIKTPGSDAEKRSRKKSTASPPDSIAIRVVVDKLTIDELQGKIQLMVSKLEAYGLTLGHTNPNDYAIEINWEGVEGSTAIDGFPKYKTRLTGPRESTYTAAHGNLITVFNERVIGLEIQIMDAEGYHNYKRGPAAHVIYKAIQSGMGELAHTWKELQLAIKSNPTNPEAQQKKKRYNQRLKEISDKLGLIANAGYKFAKYNRKDPRRLFFEKAYPNYERTLALQHFMDTIVLPNANKRELVVVADP